MTEEDARALAEGVDIGEKDLTRPARLEILLPGSPIQNPQKPIRTGNLRSDLPSRGKIPSGKTDDGSTGKKSNLSEKTIHGTAGASFRSSGREVSSAHRKRAGAFEIRRKPLKNRKKLEKSPLHKGIFYAIIQKLQK